MDYRDTVFIAVAENLNFSKAADELVVVTGANSVYAKRKQLTLDEFRQIPIVLREQGSGTLEVIRKALSLHGIEIGTLNTLIHLGSTESIKNFLLDFDGLAIISEKAGLWKRLSW